MYLKIKIIVVSLLLNFMCFGQNIKENCNKTADPSRIVSAGGSVTEILFLLEAQENIIALDVTSNYPEKTKTYTSIGYVRGLSAEGVLSVRPSLVIGEDDMGPVNTIQQIQEAKVDVRVIKETQTAEGIIDKIYCIASIIDKKLLAEKIIKNKIMPAIIKLNKTKEKNKKKKIMLVLSMNGSSPIVAGKGTSGDSFIKMVGGKNIFDSFEGWKPVSAESIIKENPDYILLPKKDLHKNSKVNSIAQDPIFSNTTAGKNNNFIFEEGMAMLGFGPRTIFSALNIALQISE
tara:strand:- start:1982 stop:2848 length:867 start_codon:yes stop_codon:yes gene_type:complete